MQQGLGSFRSEASNNKSGSVSQPPGPPVLPRLGAGTQSSSTPPQAGNILEQAGPKVEAGQVAGSSLPTGPDGKTQKEPAPVPIATPSGDGETTATPSATMPNVASLSTSPSVSPAFEVTLAGPSELSAGGVGEFVVTIKNVGAAA
jgi:hypothetical protein